MVKAFAPISTETKFSEPTSPFFYLLDSAQRIIRNNFANAGGNTTLYTVPADKILFIFNVSLTSDNDLGAASDSVNIRIANEIFFEQYSARNSTEITSVTLNMPIKVYAGETIAIYAGATAKVIGSFLGYLIPKEEAPNARY